MQLFSKKCGRLTNTLVNEHYKLQQKVFIFLEKMQLVPWASWSFVPGHPPGAVISPTMAFFFASARAVGMGTNGSAPAA